MSENDKDPEVVLGVDPAGGPDHSVVVVIKVGGPVRLEPAPVPGALALAEAIREYVRELSGAGAISISLARLAMLEGPELEDHLMRIGLGVSADSIAELGIRAERDRGVGLVACRLCYRDQCPGCEYFEGGSDE